LTTAGVEVRSSSRTSTSTRNPRPTPSHPHSTRKSLETGGFRPQLHPQLWRAAKGSGALPWRGQKHVPH